MSDPCTIIYIHHEKALGGAPLSLLYLLRQLDRAKYSPQILCLQEGPAADLFRKNGFPVQIVPGPDLSHTELVWFRWWQFHKLFWRFLSSILLFFRLRQSLLSIRNELSSLSPNLPPPSTPTFQPLVHLNSSTLLVGALAAKSLGLPVIWHIREPLARGYLGIRRGILRLAIYFLPDQIIAISRYDAAQLGSIASAASNKSTVIHNFVDFSEFKAVQPNGPLRTELNIPTDAPLILFLGGSARVKGADVLLQAAPSILGSLRTAHLLIAGETSPEFQLKATTAQLSPFRNRLHLLGHRHDIPSLLSNACVLLFPSTVPHFARPVIEAAAMARPVIASDLGGVRELVIKNETGILIPPNNPVELSRAVIELVQDEPRACRLGQQGLTLAQERFDAQQNAAATVAIYERMLKPVPRSNPVEKT